MGFKPHTMRPLLFFLLCIPFTGKSDTGDSLRYLRPHDTLYLSIGPGEMMTTHTVVAGQTLFSLAKFYGLTTQELKFFNPGLGNGLALDQQVQIPIPTKAIVRVKPDTFYRWAYAPLYYRVRPGDTVYGLSKRFFKMPIDSVHQRLENWEGTLKVGQRYFVGWLSTSGIPRELRQGQVHPLFRENYELARHVQRYVAEGKREYEQSGAAFWEAEKDSRNFYVLHDEAPLDSYLRITNPMKSRYIYAKVVGRIPRSTPPNILMVMSSRCARLLGAKDPEFFVEIQYYK